VRETSGRPPSSTVDLQLFKLSRSQCLALVAHPSYSGGRDRKITVRGHPFPHEEHEDSGIMGTLGVGAQCGLLGQQHQLLQPLLGVVLGPFPETSEAPRVQCNMTTW
jgi:hypothetical protein